MAGGITSKISYVGVTYKVRGKQECGMCLERQVKMFLNIQIDHILLKRWVQEVDLPLAGSCLTKFEK